jgi:hypothetical protein
MAPREERRRPLAELNLLEVNLLAEPGMSRRRRGCRLLPFDLVIGVYRYTSETLARRE